MCYLILTFLILFEFLFIYSFIDEVTEKSLITFSLWRLIEDV